MESKPLINVPLCSLFQVPEHGPISQTNIFLPKLLCHALYDGNRNLTKALALSCALRSTEQEGDRKQQRRGSPGTLGAVKHPLSLFSDRGSELATTKPLKKRGSYPAVKARTKGPAPPTPRESITPEMVSAFSLPKATARHDTDASLLQEFHAVKHVWSHFMGLWEEDRT